MENVRYTVAWMITNRVAMIDFLQKNPKSIAHNKVAELFKAGIGGENLAKNFGDVLSVLNPEVLEQWLKSMPQVKVQAMDTTVEAGTPLATAIENRLSATTTIKIERKITGKSAETMRATAEVALDNPQLAGPSLQGDLANMILDLLDASAEEETNAQLNDMYYHLLPGRRENVDEATFNKFYNPSPE